MARCAIISIYPFPMGMAATNRILAYSKGLLENGVSVDVLIPIPIQRNSKQSAEGDRGIYNGISYYYTIGRYSSRFSMVRAISIFSGYRKLRGFVATCRKLYEINRKLRYTAIIISTDQICSLFVYARFADLINVPAIFIFDEYPPPIRHKMRTRIPRWKKIMYAHALRKISGYVSISEKLRLFYNSICPRRSLLLPVIIDTSKFNQTDSAPSNLHERKYICYMGNMDLSKDEVDNIVKAFAQVAEEFIEIDLHLYGAPKHQELSFLKGLVQRFRLQDRIFFKGVISSDVVPKILMNAHVLVSSQPDTVRASGGFPTKLGEYLASGVPTLMTNVGENDKYVRENEHIFFAPPGNPKLFATKLSFILRNYTIAKEVAVNGRKFVFNNYSYIAMGRKLANFISKVEVT